MAATVLIVPCYNEAQRLDRERFLAFARESHNVEILFVNDGSRDGTLELLQELVNAANGRISLLDLPQNGGKAEAVRRGMLEAFRREADYVGYWDADLATPLEAVHEFVELLDQHPDVQIVFGARVKLLGRAVERQFWRHILGRVFATVVSLLLGIPIYDTQCGAKLIRRGPLTEPLFAKPFRARWIFDVEMLARFLALLGDDRKRRAAVTIYEIPLFAWRDIAGSKVKPRDFFLAIRDLAGIYWSEIRGSRLSHAPKKQS